MEPNERTLSPGVKNPISGYFAPSPAQSSGTRPALSVGGLATTTTLMPSTFPPLHHAFSFERTELLLALIWMSHYSHRSSSSGTSEAGWAMSAFLGMRICFSLRIPPTHDTRDKLLKEEETEPTSNQLSFREVKDPRSLLLVLRPFIEELGITLPPRREVRLDSEWRGVRGPITLGYLKPPPGFEHFTETEEETTPPVEREQPSGRQGMMRMTTAKVVRVSARGADLIPSIRAAIQSWQVDIASLLLHQYYALRREHNSQLQSSRSAKDDNKEGSWGEEGEKKEKKKKTKRRRLPPKHSSFCMTVIEHFHIPKLPTSQSDSVIPPAWAVGNKVWRAWLSSHQSEVSPSGGPGAAPSLLDLPPTPMRPLLHLCLQNEDINGLYYAGDGVGKWPHVERGIYTPLIWAIDSVGDRLGLEMSVVRLVKILLEPPLSADPELGGGSTPQFEDEIISPLAAAVERCKGQLASVVQVLLDHGACIPGSTEEELAAFFSCCDDIFCPAFVLLVSKLNTPK